MSPDHIHGVVELHNACSELKEGDKEAQRLQTSPLPWAGEADWVDDGSESFWRSPQALTRCSAVNC
jgi:hypothetical protein